jgi:hypothetical protein
MRQFPVKFQARPRTAEVSRVIRTGLSKLLKSTGNLLRYFAIIHEFEELLT